MSDPYEAVREAREEARQARRKQAHAAVRPLLMQLAEIGYSVDASFDLVTDMAGRGPDELYRRAVPLLADALVALDNDLARGWILRALSDPRAVGAVPVLLSFFECTSNDHLRWVAGSALCDIGAASSRDLARLVGVSRYGTARVELVADLARRSKRDTVAAEALLGVVADEVLAFEALKGVGRFGLVQARPAVVAHLKHSDPGVRRRAASVLKKLDRLAAG